VGIVEGFSNPVIVKENDSLMLYSGSQRGLTFKFLVNTDSLRSGGFACLSQDVIGINPGLRSNVSIADINHDGKNDYLEGNIRGGIMLFSDTAWNTRYFYTSIANVPANNNLLQVFPNPAKDKVICTLDKGAQPLASAQLFDLLGNAVTAVITQGGNAASITLNVSNLSEGIYILQARDMAGRSYQQKISVVK
jgi:hypothetical protein